MKTKLIFSWLYYWEFSNENNTFPLPRSLTEFHNFVLLKTNETCGKTKLYKVLGYLPTVPKTLTAASIPVMLGCALAFMYGHFQLICHTMFLCFPNDRC